MTNPAGGAWCHIPVGFSTRFLPESGQLPAFGQVLDVGECGQVGFSDGFCVHLPDTDAALHDGHGTDEPFHAGVSVRVVGRKEGFLAAQPAEQKHGTDVGFGVVAVLRGCPTADDVPHGEGLPFLAEAAVVALQELEGGTVAVGHAPELHEAGVGLLFRPALPTAGRVTDVERVVVSYSFRCVHVVCGQVVIRPCTMSPRRWWRWR